MVEMSRSSDWQSLEFKPDCVDMFDRSLLPPAEFEFVVIADTHFMLDPGERRVEFSSRLKQMARAETALKLVAALDADFVVHMGDLVQEWPDTAAFPRALDAALGQLRNCGVSPRHVAGNHDVGDKPDPTMPTRPVTPESLAAYHDACGHSWHSFGHGGCRFVVLNSQIMNSPLPEAESQRTWLERELAAHTGERLFLFLHLPPYVCDEQEAALGHYDNIAQPDRGWLLDLVRQHQVESIVAAHVHCAFFDRIGPTRYLVANSTSVTRPGFCHMFTSAAPPDHGRDDSGKLGFYLFRVFADRIDRHFIRTFGVDRLPVATQPTTRRLITRSPASLPNSPLGVTLRHPLSNEVEIPIAWPSAIRQRVRNDYPLLSCLELGATVVRTPASDFGDRLLTRRIEILRDEGVRVVATAIWSDELDVSSLIECLRDKIDGLELQLAGTAWPSAKQLDCLNDLQPADVPISLSTIIPGEIIAGKQHPRTRHGFRIGELEELNQRLAAAGVRIDRVLCRIDPETQPWDDLLALPQQDVLSQISSVDCSIELSSTDDVENALRASDALFAMTLLPESRLFVDPLIDFDRTMDVCHGLLDTSCNPRLTFHVLRCLNSIIAAARESLEPGESFVAGRSDDDENGTRVLTSQTATLCLLSPTTTEDELRKLPDTLLESAKTARDFRYYQLADALAANIDSPDELLELAAVGSGGPVAVYWRH